MLHPGYELEPYLDDDSLTYVVIVKDKRTGKEVARFEDDIEAEAKRKALRWLRQQKE